MVKLDILNSVSTLSLLMSERLFLIEELYFILKNLLGLKVASVKKFEVFWPI